MDEKILRTLGRLPDETRAKVIRLQNDNEAAAGAAKRTFDSAQEASRAAHNAKLRYDEEVRARGPRMNQLARRANESAQAESRRIGDALEELRQAVAAHADEMTRRQNAYHRAQQHFNSVGGLWNRVAVFLDRLGPRLTLAEQPKVTLKKGESFIAAVEARREKIAETKVHIGEIRRAPVTTQEAVQRAKEYCRRLRSAAAPDIDNFFRAAGDGPVIWPERQIFVHDAHGSRQTSSVRAPDVAAMLAWMHPGEFEAALVRTVEAAGDDEAEQMPLDGRDEALRGLADELEQLERQEEQLIEMAAAEGTVILRRPDVRIEVVLGVLLHHDILQHDEAA
jgi:hypothetical protein